MANILVVGARRNSLGSSIVQDLSMRGDKHGVTIAGINKHDDLELDITDVAAVRAVMRRQPWDHVVCTAGINFSTPLRGLHSSEFLQHLEVNCVGPMVLLGEWLKSWENIDAVWSSEGPVRHHHFVVISSNSAEIPRSDSMAYCASKAALSQSVRCAARAVPKNVSVWGLEPGWIDGTPMSQETADALPRGMPVMRGGAHCDRYSLAALVSWGIECGGKALNGMMIRLDGGER